MTLFSAPCYPMHQAAGELPFHNSGAVIKLTAPDYATPAARSFVAVLPRPKVGCLCSVWLPACMQACLWVAVRAQSAICLLLLPRQAAGRQIAQLAACSCSVGIKQNCWLSRLSAGPALLRS